MEELLDALEKKGLWLSKIVNVSRRFLKEANENSEIALENLDTFDQNRESLVKMTLHAENKIVDIMRKDKSLRPDAEQSKLIENYIADYQKKLEEMQRIDSEILTILDTLKVEQKAKISDLQKGKRALANYRGRSTNRSNFDVQL